MKQKRGTYDSVGIAASTFTAVDTNSMHSFWPLLEERFNFYSEEINSNRDVIVSVSSCMQYPTVLTVMSSVQMVRTTRKFPNFSPANSAWYYGTFEIRS